MPQVSTGSPSSSNSTSNTENVHWKMSRSATPSDLAIAESRLYKDFFPLSERTLPLGVSWGSSFKNLFVRAKHADHLTLHTAF